LAIGVAPSQVLHAVLTQVDRDAVIPRAQLGISAELTDGFEDLNEDLLGHIVGFIAAPEHAEYQREHAVLVELYKLVKRSLIVSASALKELTLAGFVRFGHPPPRLN